ncbi:hypothetical protein NL676_003458 [Syzygium grande]|nr:hypothetical protein NL676_003458 [Syzygium grande]
MSSLQAVRSTLLFTTIIDKLQPHGRDFKVSEIADFIAPMLTRKFGRAPLATLKRGPPSSASTKGRPQRSAQEMARDFPIFTHD